MSLNRVFIIGRLGHDPELEFVGENRSPHLQLRLATERWRGEEQGAVTEWIPVQVWGKLAETCARHLSKGQRVHIEGRLQNSTWEAEGGGKHSRLEVIATRVVFLDRPGTAAAGEEEEA